MKLSPFLKLCTIAAVCVSLVTGEGTKISACSPENNNIAISAQSSGVISTPEFPDGHVSASCIWKIQAPSKFRLEITIKVLKLQGMDDFLVFRDGGSETSPQIGKYGPCANGSVTLFSSGNSVFLQANVPTFSSKGELRIAYRPIDPDDIDCSSQEENPPNFCGGSAELRASSGVLSSPNFPNNYGQRETCFWTIIAPQGYRVQFVIHWFGIEDHRYSRPGICADDTFVVSESLGESTRLVAKLCGCREPLLTHISSKEKMWIKFTSYMKNNWPGFYATYQVLSPEECPADATSCPLKRMPPVGFNAQGQVCTVSVKTSSRVATSSAISFLLSSSLNSLPKMSSQVFQTTSTLLMKPSVSSRRTPDSTQSLTRASGHLLESTTQVAQAFNSLKSSTKTRMYSMETETPSVSFKVPFVVSTFVSSMNSFQALKTMALLSSPSRASPSETSSAIASLKESNVKLETSKSLILPSEAYSPSLIFSSVEDSPNVGSQVPKRSSPEAMSSDTLFSTPSYATSVFINSATQELQARSQGINPSHKPSLLSNNIESTVRNSSSAAKGKTTEKLRLTESNVLRYVSSTASKIIETATKVAIHIKFSTQEIIRSVKTSPTSTSRDINYIKSSSLSDGAHATGVDQSLGHSTGQTHITVVRARSSHKSKQSTEDISASLFVGMEERETIAPGAQLKNSEDFSLSGSPTTTYKSEVSKPSFSVAVKPFENNTVVLAATKVEEVSTATDVKYIIVKPSISTKSYHNKSTLAGTQTEKSSTMTHSKTVVLKPSASVGDKSSRGGSSSLQTSSEHVITQSTQETLVSERENLRPSKASEETSVVISTDALTTSVTEVATKEPQVTTTEPYDNETEAIEGIDRPPKGVTVLCTHYAMEVTISRFVQPYLVISSLHLLDPDCKVFFANNTHALLRAPLEGCDTEQKTSEDYFIYVNTMMGDAKSTSSSALITREGRVHFEFQCSYRRIHVLSIVSYSSRQKVVRTSGGEGIGNITFEMDMYEDPAYDIVVSQYPVNVHPGQTMYFQVNVQSRGGNVLAFLEECWVTPTSNPRHQIRYTIIKHGCPRDSTLQYFYQKSATQKFTFQAFKFRNEPSSRLYVHCEVVTCRNSDDGSVCETGCKENRRWRRASKPYIMDKDLFLSLGAVSLKENDAAKSSSSIIFVQTLTGVLAVIIIILVTAIVILILRRRKREKHSWILLASKTGRLQQEKETRVKLMPQTTEL